MSGGRNATEPLVVGDVRAGGKHAERRKGREDVLATGSTTLARVAEMLPVFRPPAGAEGLHDGDERGGAWAAPRRVGGEEGDTSVLGMAEDCPSQPPVFERARAGDAAASITRVSITRCATAPAALGAAAHAGGADAAGFAAPLRESVAEQLRRSLTAPGSGAVRNALRMEHINGMSREQRRALARAGLRLTR